MDPMYGNVKVNCPKKHDRPYFQDFEGMIHDSL